MCCCPHGHACAVGWKTTARTGSSTASSPAPPMPGVIVTTTSHFSTAGRSSPLHGRQPNNGQRPPGAHLSSSDNSATFWTLVHVWRIAVTDGGCCGVAPWLLVLPFH